MIVCLDVGYRDDGATAAAVLIDDWKASSAKLEKTLVIQDVADYVPGKFYQRELPCLKSILALIGDRPQVIVVDGFVTLDPDGRSGLGDRLHREINQNGSSVKVIGVAKNRFREASHAIEVYRGGSQRPLLVTASGMDARRAAELVESMHGPHRIPTMLKRVDHLSRR